MPLFDNHILSQILDPDNENLPDHLKSVAKEKYIELFLLKRLREQNQEINQLKQRVTALESR